MANYSIVVLAALLLAGIGAPRGARAQVPAGFSAPSGGVDFSAAGMSANLSASNGTGASGGSGGGNVLRAQTRNNVSSARFGSITSRPSHRSRSNEMMEETLMPPLPAKPKPAMRKFAGTYPSISDPRPTGFGLSSPLTPPAAHPSRTSSSSLQTPLYSFLVRNEKGGSHSGTSQLLRRLNHMRDSHGPPMRSSSGLGSGGGSDR
jgi:hypothetical protein